MKRLHKLIVFFILLALAFSIVGVIPVRAAAKTSTGNCDWGSAACWSPSGIPADGDDVTIRAGDTVTLNADTPNLNSLTVSGTLTLGNSGASRTVTVKNLQVDSGAMITPANTIHHVLISGNFTNNGRLVGRISASAVIYVTFNGNTNQTWSGSGTQNQVQGLTINNTGWRATIL